MINLICEDALTELRKMEDESIDLTVTSPPYDNLRDYHGYVFSFEGIAKELYRVTKQGGIVIWVVGDATIKGSETGTSFKQALYFKEVGFNLHDTMIWSKQAFTATGALKTRYAQTFEYMFVFTKGNVKTFNPIKDKPNKSYGKKINGSVTQKDGSMKPVTTNGNLIPEFGQRFNVWNVNTEVSNSLRCGHPAPFPEKLANDHIISWSNEGDTILDPFAGSGTTGVACKNLNRNYILIEKEPEYIKIINERLGLSS